MTEEKNKNASSKKHRLRPLAVFLTIALLIVGAIDGTLAWLIDRTEIVENTFTYGDININLGESVTDDGDDDPNTNEYEMVPDTTIDKDPLVTVYQGSEACWLFVQLDQKGGATIKHNDGTSTTYKFDDYLSYALADGWTPLFEDGNYGDSDKIVAGIYYRLVAADDVANQDTTYPVLADNQIVVAEDVTKEMLNALDSEDDNISDAAYPTLSITAYAIQYVGFEPEVTEGEETATDEQNNTAAWNAWNKVMSSEDVSTS